MKKRIILLCVTLVVFAPIAFGGRVTTSEEQASRDRFIQNNQEKLQEDIRQLKIIVGVLGIALVCVAVYRRKGVQSLSSPATIADTSPVTRLKCPRCGMEHASDDTICKNPNCKTQF